MTPEQNYRAAEAALEASEKVDRIDLAGQHIARAHVHALLAGVAAPTMAPVLEVSPIPSTGPLEADPCPSWYTDEGKGYRCKRPRGHMGLHVADDASAECGATVWTTDEAQPLRCAAPECDRSPGHMGAHE